MKMCVIIEEFLYAKKIENQTQRTLRGYKNLCNRKALREQIIQAIFGDGVARDFRDWDRIYWDIIACLNFEFVDVLTYQKLQKDYQDDPEKTLEHIKERYTYIVCDEAHVRLSSV